MNIVVGAVMILGGLAAIIMAISGTAPQVFKTLTGHSVPAAGPAAAGAVAGGIAPGSASALYGSAGLPSLLGL